MSNIIDSIQLSGVTYGIKGSGGTETIELTQAQYDALVDKDPNVFYIITDAEAGDLTNYYTKTETNTLLGGKQNTLVSSQNIKTINNESILGSGNIDIQGGGGSSYTAGDGIDITNDVISVTGKVDTTTYNTYTAATDTALASKQTTLTAGTGIDITDNVISATGGGGGKAIEAGTNISVTTGTTADTINCTLPISATTQYQDSHNLIFLLNKGTSNSNTIKNDSSYGNIIAGQNNTLGNDFDQAMYNFVFGDYNGLEGNYGGNHADKNFVVGDHNFFGSLSSRYAVTHTAVFGDYNQPKNHYEYVFGKYNVSNTGSTDADKTLFSVGNGTADNARHNAFEIRQNGDIYCSDGTNDVKLQDTITATAANTTALGGLKLVKLTQSEYDSLATKDNSTLYVIVN